MTTERLIFTDLQDNNNKFWHGETAGSVVKTNWGRVGATGQFKDYPMGSEYAAQDKLAKMVQEKLKKGYTRQQTMSGGTLPTNIGVVAKTQIQHKGDPDTIRLIEFLVQRNIHHIESTTTIRFEAGRLTTPLGPVTSEGLDLAEALLDRILQKDANFERYVNDYLRIIPRDFGRHRVSAEDILGSGPQVEAEHATIDSLRAVVKDYEQRAVATTDVVFQTKLDLVSDDDFRRIQKKFAATLNRMHASASLKLKKAWNISVASMEAAYDPRPGNIKELWHGTKDSNLLSILKGGFVIPKAGGSVAITGRMFGDGVYFSDQSTKSLNYATGTAPGQYGGGSQRSFMLLNDVVMGKEYNPRSSFRGTIPAGYDSCFVAANTAGVRNNEMIVYRTDRIKPTFLCEFGS